MGKKRFVHFMILISLMLLLFSCTGDATTVSDGASVTFGDAARSITAMVEGLDKEVLYWKYASRKTLVPEEGEVWIDVSGRTESYDEAGSVFVHEATPGLDGTVDGFSEGEWSFRLYGYTREGSGTIASPYVYRLVCSGESGKVELKKGEVAEVQVQVRPISDYEHGKGKLFVDCDGITFVPKAAGQSEIDEYERVITVRRFPEDLEIEDDDLIFDVMPGVYKVTVSYTHKGYRYAEETVMATVYANLVTRVAGEAMELTTSVLIDVF